MKNKIELKKIYYRILGLSLAFLLLFFVADTAQYRVFMRNYNRKLDALIGRMLESYPQLTATELVAILNRVNREDGKTAAVEWDKYGINLSNDDLITENNIEFKRFLIIDAGIIILLIFVLTSVWEAYRRHRGRELAEITRYLEELNRRNYKLEISGTDEDELSILKSEIYKTTVLLKESAENSLSDKRKLKDSLSDISHQLKTPLTSILIMLDNMMDDPDMDVEIRMDFIRCIRREVTNLNFFVGNILKLSRFDANTVQLKSGTVEVGGLLDIAAGNVAALCDLRGIELRITGERKSTISCDRKWQAEALTNIIKNCIEHSEDGSTIEISCSDARLYYQIVIQDHGAGIPQEELPHIFERFYRGRDAAGESVGIGLALAKSIVEAEHGKIHVESEPGKGTRFEIRYEIA